MYNNLYAPVLMYFFDFIANYCPSYLSCIKINSKSGQERYKKSKL